MLSDDFIFAALKCGAALSSGRRVDKNCRDYPSTRVMTVYYYNDEVKTSDNELNTKKVSSRGVEYSYISEETFK
jgi:hypothetical protein